MSSVRIEHIQYIKSVHKVSFRNVISSGFLLTKSLTWAESSWDCEILQVIFVLSLALYFLRNTRKDSRENKFQVQPVIRHKYRAKNTRFCYGGGGGKTLRCG